MRKPDFLTTERKQSFHTWRFKTFMNFYPMYFGSGGRILFWSSDYKEMHVRLKRNMWTYNLVGTIYGGSMFSSTDPFYMLMFMRLLGNDFVVWDQAASIKFIRPAKTTLYAKFLIDDDQVENVKAEVLQNNEMRFDMKFQFVDASGSVYAIVTRNLYAAKKDFYEKKKGEKQKIRFK